MTTWPSKPTQKQIECKHPNKIDHKGRESSSYARYYGESDGMLPLVFIPRNYSTCPDCGLKWDIYSWEEGCKTKKK